MFSQDEDTTTVSVEGTDPVSTEEASEEVSGEEAGVSEEEAGVGSESTDGDAFSNVNPEELAPELQAVYKQMQRDFTKKTQEVAKIKKDLEAKLQAGLTDAKLGKAPEEGGAKQPTTDSTVALARYMGVDMEKLNDADKAQLSALSRAVEGIVQERVSEMVAPISNKIHENEAVTELKAVQAKYPDFNEYADAIREKVIANPAITFEEAYKLVSYDDREAKGKEQALEILTKKKKQMPLTGKSTPVATEDEYDKAEDLRGILALGLKGMFK